MRAALVILDGWGLAEPGPGNAVDLADTPTFDALWEDCPHTTLTASGEAVGLPEGQMGNSEVGHLNLGAGAIVPQDLARIDAAVDDGSLAANEVLHSAVDGFDRVHLIGLVSDGGVHASLKHLEALVAMAVERGAGDVVVHAFTDGRDTSPHSGAEFLARVDGFSSARVGSVVGRYYAMDRDHREERTQVALDLLVDGTADHHADSGEQAVRDAYERDETDEFIAATTVGDEAQIRPEDSVLGFNFRPDRMRQITEALAPKVSRYTCLTEYSEDFDLPVAFPPARPDVTMASTLADAELGQLHVAETEKYPHVTYFFNGGEEHPYPGEERELVPSPRDVATYDEKPQMSARAAADAFIAGWMADNAPAFGIINFANPDMVGHTGVVEAAVTAIETVDGCLADVVDAVRSAGGALLVTADHGNAEHMIDQDGSPNTAHTTNPVPLVLVGGPEGTGLSDGGILGDVAPTLLELLGVDQPAAMTGRSLLAH